MLTFSVMPRMEMGRPFSLGALGFFTTKEKKNVFVGAGRKSVRLSLRVPGVCIHTPWLTWVEPSHSLSQSTGSELLSGVWRSMRPEISSTGMQPGRMGVLVWRDTVMWLSSQGHELDWAISVTLNLASTTLMG